jgi:hypothetical protein
MRFPKACRQMDQALAHALPGLYVPDLSTLQPRGAEHQRACTLEAGPGNT